MADVPAQAEVPVESRLEAFFGGAPVEPATKAPAPAPAVDGTAAEAPEAPEVTEGVESAADEAAETQPEGDEPFEELTHLDKTYEVPASLKKAFEENRALATRSAQTAKQYEALVQHATAQTQLVQAEAQFAEYAKPEMSEKAQLSAVINQYRNALADPTLDRDLRLDYMGKLEAYRAQLETVEGKIGDKQKQYQSWRSQQRQQMLSAGAEYLQKVIPNFAAENTRQSIAQQAVALGYTQDEVANMEDPRLVVALHKAAQWDRLQASKPATQNKVAKAAPIVRPAGSDSQRTEAQSKHIAARARLKKTGSVDDFAAALLTRMR